MRLFGVSLFFAFVLPFSASAAAPAPTCSMTAVPSVIQLGGSVTLKWQSQYASSTFITGVGKVATAGQVNLIPPAQGTTFKGTFVGAGGTTTCQAIVTVERSSSGAGASGAGTISTGGVLQGEGGGPITIEQQQFSQGPTVAPSPTQSSAQQEGLVQCRGLTCTWCELGKLIQRIINFLIGISIPLATLLFAWAGVLYFSSGANPGNMDRARKIFSDVFIGFLIAIGAYVIINTILVALLNKDSFASSSWFSIRCDTAERPGVDYPVTINQVLNSVLGQIQVSQVPLAQQSSAYGCEAGLEYAPDSNQCISPDGQIVKDASSFNNSIAARALAYYNNNTDTSLGPDGGNKACAWALNNILRDQGIAPIDGDSVYSMEQQLQGGRGLPVNPSYAREGDIVVFGQMSHVGVCYDPGGGGGCPQVLSNSSSKASFSSMYPPTEGSRFYRVVK
jgi:hypothetical protein